VASQLCIQTYLYALPFNAHPSELAVPARVVPLVVRALYLLLRRPHQNVVVYKGGNLERDLLKNQYSLDKFRTLWLPKSQSVT